MDATPKYAPLTYVHKRGEEIETVIEDLARLRISVFRDYPYLYEGTMEYELDYLKIYARSDRAFLFAAYDGAHMVGATTCIPLNNETPEVRRPFEDAGFDVDSIFYFGESILLHEYRGTGIGHRFFDEREAHARSFGTYKMSCFCSVDRGTTHPARPAHYRSNDNFWIKRGYVQDRSLQCFMEWKDIGQKESSLKPMIFWVKNLNDSSWKLE